MVADIGKAMMEAYRSDRARDVRHWHHVLPFRLSRALMVLGPK